MKQERLSGLDWLIRGLTLVLALYANGWAVLVLLGWMGLLPPVFLTIDSEGALGFFPVYARLAAVTWALLLAIGAWRVWTGRRRAWLFILAALPVHVVIFLSLIGNPYYDGVAGYPNMALELLAALLILEKRRRRGAPADAPLRPGRSPRR